MDCADGGLVESSEEVHGPVQRRGQVENEGFKVNSGREFFEVAASRKERTIAGHNHGAEVSGAVETLNDLKQFFTSLPTGALAFSGHRDPL